MKLPSVLIPLLLSPAIAGCAANSGDDGGDGGDDGGDEGPPVTITITVEPSSPLVAFREGLDGAWRLATMTSPSTFEAVVHGPYMLGIVCEDLTTGEVNLWQSAHTPDDAREHRRMCEYQRKTTHRITGRMVQAGRVQLGDGLDVSGLGSWDFDFVTRPGTFDLMARTADRIVLRRGIAVAGDVTVTPQIDVDQEGTALVPVAFTATNAAPGEALVASVHLDRVYPVAPLGVYNGAPGLARVVPDAALAATDAQSVSIQATAGKALRALRRPFRVGGDTVYTLPAPVEGVQWELAGGELSVSWSSAPAFDTFSIGAGGTAALTGKLRSLSVSLSPRFVEATGVTRATLDTDLPGFRPEWKLDFTRQYTRHVFVQRKANGELTTSSVTESVNAGSMRVSTAPAPAPAPRMPGHLAPP